MGGKCQAPCSLCLAQGAPDPAPGVWAAPSVALEDSGPWGSCGMGWDGLGAPQALQPHSLVLVDAAFALGVQHLEGIQDGLLGIRTCHTDSGPVPPRPPDSALSPTAPAPDSLPWDSCPGGSSLALTACLGPEPGAEGGAPSWGKGGG